MTKVMKPVWRMNTGNGVPSDFGGFVIYNDDGDIRDRRDHSFTKRDYYFHICKDKFDITHYQTTRTKAAKYERVGCGNCSSSKKKGMTYSAFYGYRKCRDCKGHGHTWGGRIK